MIGRLVGTYRITEKIGEGGMGEVFCGIDTMLEREVAIKMLRTELASQPHVVERFRTEAVTLAKLNHPNIATLYSFLRDGDDYFMVMEFVRGQSLDDVIRRDGAMKCEQAIPLFCQALDGIDHAHKMGIVHRDIKPANIMLTDNGSIKVMDFGIARVLGTARLTRQGSVVGTIEYMSPEQIRAEETDARSDVYSLGVLLYEMLTGRVPFNSTSEYELMRAQIEQAPPPPRNFAASIPLAMEQAIMRALAKRVDARFQTAGDFRAALLAAQEAAVTQSARGAGYAAPVTKAMDAPNTSRSTGGSLGQTRVVGAEGRGTGARTLEAPEPEFTDPLKQTRVAQSGDVRAAVQKAAVSASVGLQPPMPSPAQSSSTSASRSGWKLYAAAAAILLVALMGVLFALIKTRSAAGTPAAAVETEQVPPAQEQTASESATPPVETPVEKAAAVADSPATEAAKDSRSKNARVEKPESSSEATANTAPSVPVNANRPPSVVVPPPPPPNSNVVAHRETIPHTAANANANKNEKKKGGGIGGFFKRVFGGTEDAKKNDNSKPKDPKKN